jgi:hypothetical protein
MISVMLMSSVGRLTFRMSLVNLLTVDTTPLKLVFNDIIVFRRDFQVISFTHHFAAPEMSAGLCDVLS